MHDVMTYMLFTIWLEIFED